MRIPITMFALTALLSAQDSPHQKVVRELAEQLDSRYVLPDLGSRMKQTLLERLAKGAYAALESDAALADTLTLELQKISGDRHLRVYAGDAPKRSSRPMRRVVRRSGGGAGGRGEGGPRRIAGPPRDFEKLFTADNFGFAQVDVLPGNIGYIDLRILAPLSYAKDTAVQSLAKLAGTDALILDLRKCRGGTPEMVKFLCSYLFDDPILLVTYHSRGQEPRPVWTTKRVPGKKLADIPVFIVTGRRTASGAEELTFDLKHHGRAKVVGQRTAGAGHAGDIRELTHGFRVFLPKMRPVHPKTGSGFQGVGVKPDFVFAEEHALAKAHELALRQLMSAAEDEDTRARYRSEIEQLSGPLEKRSATPASAPGRKPVRRRPASERRRMEFPAPEVALAENVVRIPMKHEGGHIRVEVKLAGRGPYTFAVDTGAGGHGLIDARLAKELGLGSKGSVTVADGTRRNSGAMSLVDVDGLRVGGATFSGLKFVSLPHRGALRGFRGILGYVMFRELLMTIDYPGNEIVLQKGVLTKGAAGVVPLVGSPEIARVDITVGDDTLEARLDTGNSGGLTVSPTVLERFATEGEARSLGTARTLNNKLEMRAFALADKLTVAGFEFAETEVTVAEIFRGANLGYTVLAPFSITFDQQNRLVRFVKSGRAPLRSRARKARR